MEWSRRLNLVMPVDTSTFDFKEWLFVNGFRRPLKDHEAFDFHAYLNSRNEPLLGLPQGTKIRAVLGGTVKFAGETGPRPPSKFWDGAILIQHRGDLASFYTHIQPIVNRDDRVRKGQVIAYVAYDESYQYPFNFHLHLALGHMPQLGRMIAELQRPVDPYPLLIRKRPKFAAFRVRRDGTYKIEITNRPKRSELAIPK